MTDRVRIKLPAGPFDLELPDGSILRSARVLEVDRRGATPDVVLLGGDFWEAPRDEEREAEKLRRQYLCAACTHNAERADRADARALAAWDVCHPKPATWRRNSSHQQHHRDREAFRAALEAER